MSMRWTRPGVGVAALFIVTFMLFSGVSEARATEFDRYLAYVDQALKKNPNHVHPMALTSCLDRRNHASWLNRRGHDVRAVRSLRYCFSLLGLSEADVDRPPDPKAGEQRRAAANAAMLASATQESEKAKGLVPDLKNGLEIYRDCAACHTPEGWGMTSGMVPQLAGQHRSVITKQLADIRAGYRTNRIMAPYASMESIGGAQAVADVSAYIDTLEISVQNGKGSGDDLELGKRLYAENCVQCHGDRGQGDLEKRIPRIQSQHFGYLVTQFQLIRDGDRRNADPKMVEQIKDFDKREVDAVMDYVSRLEPPKEIQAPPDWRNPDFMLPRAAR
jgi:cytochrome c553